MKKYQKHRKRKINKIRLLILIATISFAIFSIIKINHIIYQHFFNQKIESKQDFINLFELTEDDYIINYSEKNMGSYKKTNNAKLQEKLELITKTNLKLQNQCFNLEYTTSTFKNYNFYYIEETNYHLSKLNNPKNKKLIIHTFTDYQDEEYSTYFLNIFKFNSEDELTKMIIDHIKNKDNLQKNYYSIIKNNVLDLNKVVINDQEFIYYLDSTILKNNDLIEVKIPLTKIEHLYNQLDLNKPMLALTFDDGPHRTYTDQILDVLEKYQARATFFELGKNIDQVKTSKEILQRELDLNCEIGSHSYDHPNLLKQSEAEVIDQFKRTDEAIAKRIDYKPQIYRPPYGNGNLDQAKLINKSAIIWSIDTEDWKYRNTETIVNNINKINYYDGRVILMHSIYKESAEAVKIIVNDFTQKGIQFVTISELLANKYHVNPRSVDYYGYKYFYNPNHID